MKFGSLRHATLLGLTLFVCVGNLHAQSPVNGKSICLNTGSSAPEPIGDREAHAIQIAPGTCHNEGGPLDGSVMTQNTIWEIDKGNSTLSSGNGVVRKAGGMAVYQTTSGTRTLVMKEGKVVGWTASGKGIYSMAAGSLAAVSGKTFSWTAKPTGFNQYVIDTVID